MFNSELFEDITDYSNYTENPLILAVNLQYRELLDFVDHQWRDDKEKGIDFETHFDPGRKNSFDLPMILGIMANRIVKILR